MPLSGEEEARAARLAAELVMISLHEHAGVFPRDVRETPAYVPRRAHGDRVRGVCGTRAGDAVFDNLLDGICTIQSHGGWKWDDVLHDFGMRLCDLAHQDLLIHCLRVDDILRAHREGGGGVGPRRWRARP